MKQEWKKGKSKRYWKTECGEAKG